MAWNKNDQEDGLSRVKDIVKEGSEVYCILRHVSRSGMSRVIDLKIPGQRDGNCEIWTIGYNVARALDYPYDRKNEGVKIGGCGMDMGFALVYELSQKLFGNGYKLKHRWL